MNFASLHVHDQYSLLDGAGSAEEYFARAKDLGIVAIAQTNHGTLRGWRHWQRAAKGTDIKPILSLEGYFSVTDRFDKRAKNKREDGTNVYNHLIIHAKNETGQKNLMRLNEEAWSTESYYHKPRFDRELLQRYSEGLIVTSACMSGPIAGALLDGNEEQAYRRAEWFREVFGDDFYIEVMSENPADLNLGLLKIADELQIKPILTEDAHFVHPDDLWVEESLLAVSTRPKQIKGMTVANAPEGDIVEKLNHIYGKDRPMTFQEFSLFMAGREYRQQQMLEQGIDREDIFDNTLEIANKIEEYPYHENLNLLPRPKTGSPDERLYQMCRDGMRERGLAKIEEYEARLKHELSVIQGKDFSSYFIIVGNMIRWAKRQGIQVGFARGSAAGSLVCYVLGITEVDPIKWGTIFERFIDPSRADFPDIDVDIADDRRDEVKEYLAKQYGYTANISTVTTYKEKNSLKDAASILQINFAETNKALETVESFDDYLSQPASKEFHKKYPDVLKVAKAFEGKIKSAGMHPAGVIVTTEPLSEYVPMETAKGRTKDDPRVPVVGYDMEEVEALGLIKIDLLGLKTLRVIHDALTSIKERHGKDINLYDIPLDDPKTYKMINEGRSLGIFQLEGAAFHKWIQETGCREFNDLVIGTSIARPGPMHTVGPIYQARLRGDSVKYIHPVMEEALAETRGVIVYQEQLMRTVTDLAGMSMEDANAIRRVVAKKKDPELLEKYKGEFIEGASEKITRKQAEKLWSDIEAHAGYSFNKSHAVAYSMLTNATAYLKANYPVEYMHALLKNEGDKDVRTDYLIEAKRLGIKILLPHVNKSDLEFSLEGNAIRFGLSNIKYISDNIGSKLIAARPFRDYEDLQDFVTMKGSGVNSRALDSMNKIGAAYFEDNPKRGDERDNLYEYLGIPNFSTAVHSDKFVSVSDYQEEGAFPMFAMVREIVRRDGWARATVVDSTGSVGIFIDPDSGIESGQMYAFLIADKRIVRYIPAEDLDKVQDSFTQYLFEPTPADLTEGFYRVIAFKRRKTKAGKNMASIVLQDHEGELLPVIAFPQKYPHAMAHMREGATKMVQLGTFNDTITYEGAE